MADNKFPRVSVGMIVAMATNGVIGRDNQLPWHLPGDLKYFKAVTMGKPIIMGRKTYESIGRPLPGRPNIVISRDAHFQADQVLLASTIEEALTLGKRTALDMGADEVMIIGGSQVYHALLPLADRLYLTEVQTEVEGDSYFPEFDVMQWQEIERTDFLAEGDNPFDYSFVIYQKLPN